MQLEPACQLLCDQSETDPSRFFVPPYVGHNGWIGVRLEPAVDWDELADLINDAYRMTAPKKLVAQLDAE